MSFGGHQSQTIERIKALLLATEGGLSLFPPHEIVVGIVLGEAKSLSFDVIVVFRCSDRFDGILGYPLFVAIVICQVTSTAFVYYELGASWD